MKHDYLVTSYLRDAVDRLKLIREQNATVLMAFLN